VKNLDDGIDDERLRKEFSPFGTITSAKVKFIDCAAPFSENEQSSFTKEEWFISLTNRCDPVTTAAIYVDICFLVFCTFSCFKMNFYADRS